MNRKLLAVLAFSLLIVGSGWAAAAYLGPRLFKTSHSSGDNTKNTSMVKVSVLVSFGNGTRLWFNDTAVPNGYNYYNVTYKITNGDLVATWFDSQHSHFIAKLFGIGCDSGDPFCPAYWSLWTRDQKNLCWNYSPEGVDELEVSDVSMIAWHFLRYDNTNPLPGRCG